ncbi:hypothetical protein [Bifidobacterium sp. SO1]|nr:hypothetical protein [Bifidobacterium sp. SO1]MBT1161262.1 hypothetical protein [Bifidobacterium sp. SO1]
MTLHLYADETPPDDECCPLCGSPLNAWGHCMEERLHDDPYDGWRDE